MGGYAPPAAAPQPTGPVGITTPASASYPPPPGQQGLYYNMVDKDVSDLKMLSIFWYVLAGLQALGACIFLLYIGFGLVMMVLGGAAGAGSGEAGAAVPFLGMGAFMLCLGIVPLAIIGTIAYLNYVVGKSLPQRRNLTLIYVMAGLACLGFPLGTVLGVFTFMVVSRPSIKATFT